MKNIKVILALLLLTTQGAQALTLNDIPHWTHDRTDTVQWVPPLRASVNVTNLEADDEYWAQVTVSIAVESELASQASQMLRVAYPTKKLNRSFARASGSWEISIPSLGKSQTVDAPTGSSELPWTEVMLFLSKSEYRKLKETFKLSEPLSWLEIKGEMASDVKELRLVESLKLDASDTCRQLDAINSNIESVILRYAQLSTTIEKMGRFSESRESLKRQVLRECVEIIPGNFHSFTELLDGRSVAKNPVRDLVGEAHQEQRVQKTYALPFVMFYGSSN